MAMLYLAILFCWYADAVHWFVPIQLHRKQRNIRSQSNRTFAKFMSMMRTHNKSETNEETNPTLVSSNTHVHLNALANTSIYIYIYIYTHQKTIVFKKCTRDVPGYINIYMI